MERPLVLILVVQYAVQLPLGDAIVWLARQRAFKGVSRPLLVTQLSQRTTQHVRCTRPERLAVRIGFSTAG